MKKKRERVHNKVVFKKYIQDEPVLFPTKLGDMIPKNHLVRVVSEVIDEIDLSFLYLSYKGGGRSSYHPKMLLKVLLYAYTQKIYSSRRIAKALRENIYFMWLSGNNQPDFRTINRFRKEKLGKHMTEIFSLLLVYLYDRGYVDLNNYFLDGTKIEANANRYSFVWSKSVKYFKQQLMKNVNKLLSDIDKLNEEEDNHYRDKDLEETGESARVFSSDELKEIARELEESLRKEPANKKLKKKIKKLKEDYIPRLSRYESQEKKFNGRNSYSKTDEDATFMRLKDDTMGNGQLKAAYNVQIGTQNQFILWYSIHQNRSDAPTLRAHIDSLEGATGLRPLNLIADSGYGSLYNYLYLSKKGIKSYVKYTSFYQENKRKFKKNKFKRENWYYDSENDVFICGAGNKLFYKYRKHKIRKNRLEIYKIYETRACVNCKYKSECSGGKDYKRIWINPVYEKFKSISRRNLLSSEGKKLSILRNIEVESVFGNIKQNMGFRRFSLRGLEKVKLEFGLISLAHNLKKLFRLLNNNKPLTEVLNFLNRIFYLI